uniref:Insulin-like domain-containing protein n=1 Tax=Electrophorus electricus TaxID=8005 RepID=A0A4W4ERM1_ELEEL
APRRGTDTCQDVSLSCLVLPKQVFCLRGVCVSYTLLLVLLLPELGLVARPRCGVELIADLEFVCGDRGFYRGRARNGGSRSRGNGIVEQCCIKGCDLQHLEQYCAKPSRGRRQAPAFPLPTREAQFQMLFLKQYQRFLELNPEKLAQRMQEQSLYLETLRNPTLLNSNEKISNPPHSPTSPLRALTALRHLYEPSQPYVTSTSPHSPTSPLRALTALRHLYEPSQPYVTSTSPHSPTSPLRALTALRHLYEPSQPCVTSTSPHSPASPLRALTALRHL